MLSVLEDSAWHTDSSISVGDIFIDECTRTYNSIPANCYTPPTKYFLLMMLARIPIYAPSRIVIE